MTAEDLEKHILRDEIERLTKALHYEQHWLSRIGTHGPGCWEWGPAHYDCAVKEIKDAEKNDEAVPSDCPWSHQSGSDAPCRYPDCVDNGPEGKCIRWLLAECEKSEDYRGNRKQWQNLTDDEIKKILGLLGTWGPMPIKGYTRKLFDEIEAALREKNT